MKDRDPLEAYTRAYLDYLPALRRLVTRTLRGTSIEAEDVLQDVWINGARGWAGIRNTASCKVWLGSIAVNAALTARKKEQRQACLARRREEAFPSDIRDPAPGPLALTMRRRELEGILEAVESLAPRIPGQIALLRLVHLEGRTYAEAAAFADIAEGTAKSQVFKAVSRLRALLANDNDDPAEAQAA